MYELNWRYLPMGSICGYEDWQEPFLGSGIYMLAVATTTGDFVGYYIGKSVDIGNRWRYHVDNWFLEPHGGYCIPVSATDFINDPVAVLNNEELERELPNRRAIQHRILSRTWFAWAEINDIWDGHRLENVEYVLQRGLMQHAGIEQGDCIGLAGVVYPPNGELLIRNRFGMERDNQDEKAHCLIENVSLS